MVSFVPKPGILDISPYIGGEARAEGALPPARLASNENPLGCSPEARSAYASLVGELHRYPDGSAQHLRACLARRYGLEAENIVCGAGSDELISLLIRAYAGPGDEVLHSAHGFLMYAIGARAAGARPVAAVETGLKADIGNLLKAVTPATRLLFLANPNNPTGTMLTATELEALRAALPRHVLLVIDSAYAEYVTRSDYTAGEALVRTSASTVMLRTFSKIHGLAALRLGWAYCPPEVADVLNRVRGPFNVPMPAQAAGAAALTDPHFAELSVAHNAKWRAWLSARLQELRLDAVASEGNFLLVQFGTPDRADGARLWLKSRGVLVRQVGAYGLPGYLRMTIGTDGELQRLVTGLKEWMEQQG